MTVQRKYKEAITLRLNTRLIFCANELPAFTDASSALVNRFIFLHTPHSFLGNEDHDLEKRLREERAQILKWAILGYQRLKERGRFVQPNSGKAQLESMMRLASPLKTFVNQMCNVAPENQILCEELRHAFKLWCVKNDLLINWSPEFFGQKLSAALPSVTRSERGKPRKPYYVGLALKNSEEEQLPWEVGVDGVGPE